MGLIYLDACLLIYAFEEHPLHGARVRQRLSTVAAGALAISPLVQLECLVGPMKTGNLVLQHHYEEGLRQLTKPMPMARAARAACAAPTGARAPRVAFHHID